MAADYSSPYSDDLGSDAGISLIPGYAPFIGDVAYQVRSDPFPVDVPDERSEEEIDRIRLSLRREVSSKEFEHPIALADYCLIAPTKWEAGDSSDDEFSAKYCILL
jgi:hypothetical protein